MFKQVVTILSALAMSITCLSLPAKAEERCYSEIIKEYGTIEYGQCVPYPINIDYSIYMQMGVNAALPEGCASKYSKPTDWDTAIINFQKAYDEAEVGSEYERHALRGLIASQIGKEEQNKITSEGDDASYYAWVMITGLRSACD